jgi:threonine efflux protein
LRALKRGDTCASVRRGSCFSRIMWASFCLFFCFGSCFGNLCISLPSCQRFIPSAGGQHFGGSSVIKKLDYNRKNIVIENALLTANLTLAYSAYALGIASPGPSNLAVMATAMDQGRRSAIVFALGVVSGSTLWGLLAALGLSTVIARYSQALVAMKVIGGIYLLWLAFKSAKSALKPNVISARAGPSNSTANLYLRGAAIHLTNPKAIFVWLSIVALALPASAHRTDALLIVAGCVPIGIAVFCGYALAFSTAPARQAYMRTRRWFDGTLAVLFGYAGIRMLASHAAD